MNLKGSVDSLDDKIKVEQGVKKIDGVKQVNNQIGIVGTNAKGYTESQLKDSEKKYPQDYASSEQDRQLNAKIHDKLSGGIFSKGFDQVVIKTTNGVVVLTGTVGALDDIQKVQDQIKGVDGVKSINNQLTVKK